MAVMPLPWRALREYAEFYNLDEDSFEDLQFILRKMDDAYLNMVNKHGNAKDTGPSPTKDS